MTLNINARSVHMRCNTTACLQAVASTCRPRLEISSYSSATRMISAGVTPFWVAEHQRSKASKPMTEAPASTATIGWKATFSLSFSMASTNSAASKGWCDVSTTDRLRPASFARYRPTSARLTINDADSPRCQAVMPAEHPTDIALRMLSATRTASRSQHPGSSNVNSSPPIRASIALVPNIFRHVSATSCRATSPAA